jgi:hypothetical protein
MSRIESQNRSSSALLLNGLDVLRRHHRNAAMQGTEDLRVPVGPDAIAERGQAIVDLGPEGDTGSERDFSVDGPERAPICSACTFPAARRLWARLA